MSAPICRPQALLPRVWMVTVAVVLFFGMLAAFHQVVRDAVHQAELRHQANAVVVEAIWRCNAASPPVAATCATKPSLGRSRTEYAAAAPAR